MAGMATAETAVAAAEIGTTTVAVTTAAVVAAVDAAVAATTIADAAKICYPREKGTLVSVPLFSLYRINYKFHIK